MDPRLRGDDRETRGDDNGGGIIHYLAVLWIPRSLHSLAVAGNWTADYFRIYSKVAIFKNP